MFFLVCLFRKAKVLNSFVIDKIISKKNLFCKLLFAFPKKRFYYFNRCSLILNAQFIQYCYKFLVKRLV